MAHTDGMVSPWVRVSRRSPGNRGCREHPTKEQDSILIAVDGFVIHTEGIMFIFSTNGFRVCDQAHMAVNTHKKKPDYTEEILNFKEYISTEPKSYAEQEIF